jgi:hypothetical protein
MFPDRVTSLFRFMLNIGLWASILIAVVMASLYLRLSMGPLDLNLLKEAIQDSLNREIKTVSFTLQEPRLVWQGWKHPIEVHAREVRLHHAEAQHMSLTIPEIAATFRLRSLLVGRLTPASLTLIRPTLTVQGGGRNAVSPAPESPAPLLRAALTNFAFFFLNLQNFSPAFKRLTLQKAKIVIENPHHHTHDQSPFIVPEISIALARDRQGIRMNLESYLSGEQREEQYVGADVVFSPVSGQWQGFLEIHRLNPAILTRYIDNLFDSLSVLLIGQEWAKIKEYLQQADLPLTGKIEGQYDPEQGLIKADFFLESKGGLLTLQEILPKPLTLNQLRFSGHYRDQKLSIDTCTLDLPEGRITVQTEGDYVAGAHALQLKSHMKLADFAMDRLADFWPEKLAPLPRAWVLKNIPQGQVPKATLNIQGNIDLSAHRFRLTDINGDIHLQETTLTYLEGMPPITGVRAIAHYDAEKFQIAVLEGVTLKDLKLQKGQVDITGLHTADQDIHMHLTVDGPIAKALALLDHKPLEFIKMLNIPTTGIGGTSITQLSLSFPLSTTLKLAQIEVQAQSALQNLSLRDTIQGIPIALTKGQATLRVNQGEMHVTGHAELNGDPATIEWQRYLTAQTPVLSRLNVHMVLSPQGLQKIQPSLATWIKGWIDLELNHELTHHNTGHLALKADLQKTEVNLWGWKKTLSRSGKVYALLGLKEGRLFTIKTFQAESNPDLAIDIEGHFDKAGQSFTQLIIKRFRLGKTDLQGSLRPHKHTRYRLQLNGESLDLEPYLEDWAQQQDSAEEWDVQFDLIAKIKHVFLEDHKRFYNNSLSLTYRDKRIHSLSYTGLIEPKGEKHLLVSLFPHAQGRRFVVECEQAGDLLKALGILQNMHGGQLKLVAFRPDSEGNNKAPWEGKVLIENFKLSQVPFLGHLFSLAFPTGFADFFTEGNKLSFHKLKARFKADTNKLLIMDGYAYGPSLGFTMGGSIQNKLTTLNIHGSLIPAYFLNTLIAKIPLFGHIITGGKHEGLFGVSYTVQGHRNTPQIQVNPLSTLTPGLLRRLFAPSDTDDLRFEEFEEEIDPDDENEKK